MDKRTRKTDIDNFIPGIFSPAMNTVLVLYSTDRSLGRVGSGWTEILILDPPILV